MNEGKSDVPKEILIEGIPASPGAVVGFAYIHSKEKAPSKPAKIEKTQVSSHLESFDSAREKLITQWEALQNIQSDESLRNVLSAQIEIIRDPELAKRIKGLIKNEHFGVQKAVKKAFEEYIDIFTKSGSTVLGERVIDVTDIRDQLLEAVGGNKPTKIEKKGDIVVAQELSPREVIALSHQNIKGIIMERGGSTSHAAIIARSVGIPAVTGARKATELISDNVKVCLNGQSGIVYINPEEYTCSQIQKLSEGRFTNKEVEKIKQQSCITADGHKFTLRANIEFTEELSLMQRYNAEGIGLLRTEAIYLNRAQFGSRENQQLFYEDILQKTEKQPVTIRLFDVGGDKFLSEKITENNPFLGWRGIRMLLDERELLREQLTAILAAAGNHPGKVKLLLPMVTMISEIDEVKKEVERCKKILADEGSYMDNNMPLGIMVETPNVAIQSQHFAKEVDFFSIGTNDLIQYLLAVDRGNPRISKLYNQVHPVMWQMIDQTIKAARGQGIEVEVCGELASYPAAGACLLGLGINGLSMSPAAILQVKKLLVSRTFKDMKALAEKALKCTTLDETEALFKSWKKEK